MRWVRGQQGRGNHGYRSAPVLRGPRVDGLSSSTLPSSASARCTAAICALSKLPTLRRTFLPSRSTRTKACHTCRWSSARRPQRSRSRCSAPARAAARSSSPRRRRPRTPKRRACDGPPCPSFKLGHAQTRAQVPGLRHTFPAVVECLSRMSKPRFPKQDCGRVMRPL